ncbi:hypothetical protein J5N97_022930 [Dioscorea zingiberensis]|uniref:Uncharacterized protein n=1 Tax=Dioscorea zingiberensis TaxID=325984 RepID=A0A9D5HBG4_9LILI|nr:hypothetical protein J5N97_022930 [Dioscorea zingiberensis]
MGATLVENDYGLDPEVYLDHHSTLTDTCTGSSLKLEKLGYEGYELLGMFNWRAHLPPLGLQELRVQARNEQDKNQGGIIIPEGLVEGIPELYALLQDIQGLHGRGVSIENISAHLSPWTSTLFAICPPFIKLLLLLHPEYDDSAQLS